jgi:arginyl-tRNA synthetase
MTMKPELAALISSALEQLVLQGTLADMPDAPLQIDHPKDPSHGDLSCNVADGDGKARRFVSTRSGAAGDSCTPQQ